MRVLQIMRAPVGGLFRHVADLTRSLAERGHEVGIVADSLTADAQTEAKLAALADCARLGIYRLPIPRVLGPADITTPLRLRKLASRLDVHLLHGHGAKGGFGARLARIGGGKRAALYTPHGGALHFDKSRPSGALFMAIERGLLGATDALIFESAHAQTVFAQKVTSPRCRNLVIHNGLAQHEFEAVTPAPDAADFVFIGELRLLKGIDLLVDALADIKRPDGVPATLVMAGDGPDAESLRNRIAALGLSDRVSLVGAQPAREMFARGHIVVVPSRAESLPYIVLEASAAGRPVLATRVGGIAEIYGPTADSLVAPDSVAALRSAMDAALRDPARSVAEADQRKAFIAERFSLATMTDRIENLYRNLISSAR